MECTIDQQCEMPGLSKKGGTITNIVISTENIRFKSCFFILYVPLYALFLDRTLAPSSDIAKARFCQWLASHSCCSSKWASNFQTKPRRAFGAFPMAWAYTGQLRSLVSAPAWCLAARGPGPQLEDVVPVVQTRNIGLNNCVYWRVPCWQIQNDRMSMSVCQSFE